MPKNWIAVASAEHARRGREGGFMQVCHGKAAPLRRMGAGDRVAYYAPTLTMGTKEPFQSFVSIGVVQATEPYPFDMGGGFVPHRRDVAYADAHEAAILPLLDHFEFVENRQRWGYTFRFGLFDISDHDMRLIARWMATDSQSLHF